MTITKSLGFAAVGLALIAASPTLASPQQNVPTSDLQWQVADRFRLFDEAVDQRTNVNDLLKTLAAPNTNLADHHQDFLALLSDLDTGYSRSAALRRSHYRTDPPADEPGHFDADYLYPKTYTLELRDESKGAAQCSYRSAIEERWGPCGAWTRIAVPSGDGARHFAGSSGTITVTVDQGPPKALEYRFDDVLVVALGDSFISGEGNPDVPSLLHADPKNKIFARPSWGAKVRDGIEVVRQAHWWDTPCHRSLLSWPVLATLGYAARHPHSAVSLVHLGCSGAIVDELVDRGEVNLPGGGNARDSQIVQLTKLLSAAPDGWKVRTPDRILLSIGGNDMGFVGVITTLMLPPNGYLFGPLVARKVGKDAEAVCPYRSTGLPLARLCQSRQSAEERLQTLHVSYRLLAAALADLGVTPDRVYHAQYPNPLLCANARPCDNNAANSTPGVAPGERGFEALMGILPKIARGFRYNSWNFELQYYPEDGLANDTVAVGQLLYPELPDVRCDNIPEESDSEVCQGLLVHYRLNREVRASGFRTLSGHLSDINGHGLVEKSEGYDLGLPTAQGGRWSGKAPDDFNPYLNPQAGRWFRLPNDSILTQFQFYQGKPRFHQGTVHPTYRAHLAYAQAALDEALDAQE